MNNRERWIVGGIVSLTVFAFLLNLGVLPLRMDEAIRSTVSSEMMMSGNYITPTMWGEYYYSKPPLFNWILIGFFTLFDSFSLFVYRLPSVLAYFGIALVTWAFSRKYVGERVGVLAALSFLFCGSVLVRDSLYGYIDPVLALVTLLSFVTIFRFHERKQYWLLFMVSYALAATGVLLKGLPSVLFQGITLVAWFAYKRDFKALFRPAHFAGVGVFLLIVGVYFFVYSEYNDIQNLARGLTKQATIRTPTNHPWYDTLFYFLTFPFENFGLLLPTSLFSVFAFRKGMFKRWMSNDFTAFLVIVLAANVLPYWFSPGYRFRYLMMLYPLWLILGAEAYYAYRDASPKLNTWMERIFLLLGCALIPLTLFGMFSEEFEAVSNRLLIGSTAILALAGLLVLWFRYSNYRVYWFFGFLLVFRFGFDLGWMPYYASDESRMPMQKKVQAERVLEVADDRPIRVYYGTPLFRASAFYLGSAQERVIEETAEIDPAYLYLVNDTRLKKFDGFDVDTLYRYELGYKDYMINLIEVTPRRD